MQNDELHISGQAIEQLLCEQSYKELMTITCGLNNLFSATLIKFIENSLTAPGFPRLFVKDNLFSRFSRFSMNPGLPNLQNLLLTTDDVECCSTNS